MTSCETSSSNSDTYLIAVPKGVIKFNSRNLLVAESTIYNEADKVIAFGTGNFAKSKILLKDCDGYKLE